MATSEASRAAFRDKNARRKTARESASFDPNARYLRKQCGGTFGRLPAKSFNIFAEGTAADLRLPPRTNRPATSHADVAVNGNQSATQAPAVGSEDVVTMTSDASTSSAEGEEL